MCCTAGRSADTNSHKPIVFTEENCKQVTICFSLGKLQQDTLELLLPCSDHSYTLNMMLMSNP